MPSPVSKIIADFEILEKVGQGGMGAVFRARQISMDRVVALKILAPKLANDSKFKARFMREARVSAKLNHLNIINGIECGEENGVTFFAMEFVDGTTVRQILKARGKLPLDEAARIVRQVAEALVYVDKNNIIHRDIKPDNVMLTKDGTAKLCDLGLAKLTETDEELAEAAEHNAEANPELTRSGQTMGTPYYISPEQAKGKKDVDIRADIYCLGGTLYHMLTGRPPFSGKGAMEIMARHLSDEAPGLCELEPTISDDWGWVVTRMMAKNADERYGDPKELIADLEAAIAGKPVKARGFKGRSSCAAPRSGKKAATAATAKPSAATITATKKPSRAADEDTPVRETTMSLPPRVRSSTRGTDSHTGLVLGGVAALGLLVVGAMMFGGGKSGSSTSSNTKHASLTSDHQNEVPAVKPLVPPPVAEKRPPAAKDDPKPPETPQKVDPEVAKEAKEKRASELLEKARELEKTAADDFAGLLAAYDAAEQAAKESSVAADAHTARNALLERWNNTIESELKKLSAAAEPALKKGDFSAAAKEMDREKLPEALRVADWEERLARTRKQLSDAAEAAAAKIVTNAQIAVGAGDDVAALEKAAGIASQAESIPQGLAPSVARAAQLKEKWLAKASELKKNAEQTRHAQLSKAREKLPPFMRKLVQMLKDSSFASVVDAVEKQRADPANSDIKEVLKREKEDLQALLALRQAAFDALKKKVGEKVRLHNRRDIIQATIKETDQPNRLQLVLAQGATDVGPESLEPLDVLALVAPREDGSDLKSRALLLLSAGDLVAAREHFTRAKDAGQADAVALYTDYFEALDGGEQETAAKKAWADAEKLFDAKKTNEARDAYLNFQKQFARTKAATEVATKLKERLASFDAATQAASSGPGLLAEYTSPKGAAPVQRVDPQVDFKWGEGPPAAGLGTEFTATWKGKIKIEREGEYTFSVVVESNNCSAMLSVDNDTIVNQDFSAVTRRIARDDIDLEPGVYPISLTYTQSKGPGGVTLKWAVAGAGGHGDRVIPADAFVHGEVKDEKPADKKELKNGTFLSDLEEENVKMGFGKFGRNGDLTLENRRIKVNGVEYPKALYMRPAHRGSASVTYDLDRDYSTFKTRVAVDDFSPGAASPLTFKVFGDGQLLWSSEPVQKPRRHQETTLDVKGVDKLEIRVEAKDSSQDGHAVWLDPQVFK